MTINKENIQELPETTLLFAYISGNISAEDKDIVEKWLEKDKANEKELLQIARIYFAERNYQRIKGRNPIDAFYNFERKIKKKKRKIWLQKVAFAASIAALILLSNWLIYDIYKHPDRNNQQYITVTSNSGMRTKINLPDGTLAYLNSGSSLSYPVFFDREERKIRLDGEGFFKVIHDSDRPFIVSVLDDKYKVKVLGTEFNLQAYENDGIIETTLLSGLVNLEIENKTGKISTHRLNPSEKASYFISENKINIERVNPFQEIAWIDGKLIFKDTPLPVVLRKLSHFYNVKFKITDPVLNTYHITGTLVNRQLSQVLDYMKLSSNIDYKINEVVEDDSNGLKYTIITLRKNK